MAFDFLRLFGVGKKDAHEEISSIEEGHDAHDHEEVAVTSAPAMPDDIGQVALDVVETSESLVIIAPLAGVQKDRLNINLERNILTISGSREKPKIQEVVRPLVSECFFGPFSRSIILPENLALNKIKAVMEENLLIVTIPRLVLGSKSIKIERLSTDA